jgi:threonine dehydratase
MWERAKPLVSDSFVVSLEATAATVKLLLERERIVAEGAAAMPVAAALSGAAGDGRIVCIVSGGNIDSGRLTEILAGRVPA